ncbi:MAG: universal stress protein, partial [Thermoproteota archaeon]
MKVLIATDGGKHSKAALEAVKMLDPSNLDEVRIISVVDMSIPLALDVYAGYLPSSSEIEKTARENAENIVKSAAQKVSEIFQHVNVQTEVLAGSPESCIVETAEKMKADLIIVGSHSYNRWERLL